jgi:pimeloyl-ACP methyl ester carboxylesterase
VAFQSLAVTQAFFADPNVFIPFIYGSRTVQPLDETVMDRLMQESDHTEQLALTAHRLFKDNFPDDIAGRAHFIGSILLAAEMTMPVMLIQADQDPAQPLHFLDGSQGDPAAADLFTKAPFAQLWVITESGHFTELEQPEQVSQALQQLLAIDPEQAVPSLPLWALLVLAGALLFCGRYVNRRAHPASLVGSRQKL